MKNTSLFQFNPLLKIKKKVAELVDHPIRSLEEKGIDNNVIKQASDKAAETQKMDDLIRKSNRTIITISSLFPWDLFPNSINVEESRITFVFRQFMATQSHSLDIKDISNVFIESSLFFATLQIVSRTYVQNDIKIGHLNKKLASQVRTIIEGLRTFNENKINTSNYHVNELLTKIQELHVN